MIPATGVADIIGIDPGPTPGIARITVHEGRLIGIDVVQCSEYAAMIVLNALLYPRPALTTVAMERFVRGPRSGRLATPRGGAAALRVIERVQGWAAGNNVLIYMRNASEVKRWAVDERLAVASLLQPTIGMTHARDGARHALYAAVFCKLLADPLSRDWKPPAPEVLSRLVPPPRIV